LRLEEWQRTGQAVVVKSGLHRTVYRVQLGCGEVYVKHCPLHDLRAQVRQKLRPSKARTEAELANRLIELGIPTITPLAVGETAAGESCLVTAALSNAATLKDFVEAGRSGIATRFELARGLAELLAAMHDAGVGHGDLHAGNILVTMEAASLHFHLIDLHAVRLGSPLDWPASRDNLVLLNRWFVQRSTRADRLRFWKQYLRYRRRLGVRNPDCHKLARELERRTWASCLAFWRKRDGRCTGENRYFYRAAGGRCQAHAVRGVPLAVVQDLLRDPDEPFAKPIRMLKHSRSSTVAEIELLIDGRLRRCIWKRFAVTKWSDPLVHLIRSTPGLRSWVGGHRLLECGMPTPRPLVVLQRFRHGLPHECYLLTEVLADAVDLHSFWVSLATPTERRELVERAARLIRDLHRRGLAHRDLKAANVLVGADGELSLIDLVGLERSSSLSKKQRVRNLARLHASFHDDPRLSKADKLRFLRVYLSWGLFGKEGWKAWWQAIAEATARKINRNRRRGRPLT